MKITIDEIRKLVEQELQKEDCWDGYERVPGSAEGSPGSCRKKKKLKEESDLEFRARGLARHFLKVIKGEGASLEKFKSFLFQQMKDMYTGDYPPAVIKRASDMLKDGTVMESAQKKLKESEYEAAMRRLKDKAEAGSVSIEVEPEEEENDDDLNPYDDEDVAESRSSYNRDTIRKMVEEEIQKLNEKPAKGKKSSKTYINPKTGRKNKTSYGQKGATISPGTSKGDSYCARSFGIKKRLSKKKQNDPNTANNLSRKKWKCKGAKSSK